MRLRCWVPGRGGVGRLARTATASFLALGALFSCVSTLSAQEGVIELPGGGFRYQNVRVLHGDYQNVVAGEIVNATGGGLASVEFSVNIHGRYGILIGTELLVLEDFREGETRAFCVPTGIDIGQIRNISITLAEGE